MTDFFFQIFHLSPPSVRVEHMFHVAEAGTALVNDVFIEAVSSWKLSDYH